MKNQLLILSVATLLSAGAGAQTTTGTTVPGAAGERGKTAMDQGASEQDTAMTRIIREHIVADQSLSMRAKNITIITQEGRVLLKGPVANAAEKSKVEAIAKKVSGIKSVSNMTEITAK